MTSPSWSFFSTPSLQGLLQQLNHLSQFGASALVVEGDVGSGKTSLLTQLHQQLVSAQHNEIPLLIANLSVAKGDEPFSILAQLAGAFGIDFDQLGEGELITRLRSFVQALFREKQLAIALIDDADNIDSQELGALLSLLQQEPDATFGLKFVFCSRPGFASALDELGLVDLAIYDFQMPVFSAQEIESLVTGALPEYEQGVENSEFPSFSSLWSRSRGNPGTALDIATSALKVKTEKGLSDDIRKMPVLHIVVVAILLAALLFMFFYGGSEENKPEQPERKQGVLTPESVVNGSAKANQGAEVPKTILADSDSMQSEEGASEEPKRAPNFVQDTRSSTMTLPTKEPAEDLDSSETKGGKDIPMQDDAGAIYSENAALEPGDKAAIAETRPSNELDNRPSADERLSEAEKRLIALADSQYLLQLLAATQKNALEEFIAEQPNKDSMLIYRKARDSAGPWYVVAIGPFSNKSQAQSAISTLPAAQKKSGPWPKSAAAVKSEIRAYHGI